MLAPSPPVPTTSTESSPNRSVGTRRAWRSMVSASSVTSPEVGPFIFIAMPNAAIWAGVAVPVMIWSMAQAATPGASDRLVVSRPSSWGQVWESSEGTGAG